MNDNDRTPEEQGLTEKLRTFLRTHTRAGTRLVVHSDGYTDVRVYCGGAVPITAYSCALQPGHEGKCFSSNKQVHFKPEVGTPRAEEQTALLKSLELTIRREPFERACFTAGGEDSAYGTSIEYAECVRADLVRVWLRTLENSFGGKKELRLDGKLLPESRKVWNAELHQERRNSRLPLEVLEELWVGCATDIKKQGSQRLPDDLSLFLDAGPVVRRAP